MTLPPATRLLSEEAYALAARYDLGAPLAQYQRRFGRQNLVGYAVLLLAASLLLLLSFVFTNVLATNADFLRLMALFATVSMLDMMIRDLIYRRTCVLVCSAGLVWRRGRKQEVVRWEEIESVAYGSAIGDVIEQIDPWRIIKPSWHGLEPLCAVRRTDGTKLTCRLGRLQTRQLGESVARASLPYVLPRALESYNYGATVSFGPLAVRREGISRKQKFLPWNQYQGYLITEGVLTIWQPGGEPWVRLPLRQISNLLVLTNLLDEIRQYQRQGVIS